MNLFSNGTFECLTGSPKAALRTGSIEALSLPALLLLAFSSILSLSLAETVVVGSSWGPWALSFGSSVLSLVLWTSIFFELSKAFNPQMAPWRDWFGAATLSLLPLHLLLPIGLLLANHGMGALLVYEVAKALVLLAVVKRAAIALQLLNGWPAWGAIALLTGPFIIGGLAFLLLLAASLLGTLLLAAGLAQ